MFEKIKLKRKLKATTKAKVVATRNNNFELAAAFRDREKNILKELGYEPYPKKQQQLPVSYLKKLIKRIHLKFKIKILNQKRKKINRLEIESIKALNYQKANEWSERSSEILSQMEVLENDFDNLK